METDDLNIEAHLAYSEKLYGLTTGHQQETTQLLEDIEQLQTYVRLLQAENRKLRQENADKDKTIARLNAENEQFRTTPNQSTTINASQYIENQIVNKQYQLPEKSFHWKQNRKSNTNDKKQLQLWQPVASLT